jgi:hypothetical protein
MNRHFSPTTLKPSTSPSPTLFTVQTAQSLTPVCMVWMHRASEAASENTLFKSYNPIPWNRRERKGGETSPATPYRTPHPSHPVGRCANVCPVEGGCVVAISRSPLVVFESSNALYGSEYRRTEVVSYAARRGFRHACSCLSASSALVCLVGKYIYIYRY